MPISSCPSHAVLILHLVFSSFMAVLFVTRIRTSIGNFRIKLVVANGIPFFNSYLNRWTSLILDCGITNLEMKYILCIETNDQQWRMMISSFINTHYFTSSYIFTELTSKIWIKISLWWFANKSTLHIILVKIMIID